MSEQEEIPKDVDGAVAYIKKHFIAIIFGVLGVGGGGTGVAFSDAIHKTYINYIAQGLDTLHGIKPIPADLMKELKQDSLKLAKKDSIDDILLNFMRYQIGFNNNVAMSDNKIDTVIDKIPMKYDTKSGVKWIEWDGYVYNGVSEGNGKWAVFLFKWQIPEGADNHFAIDPIYYEIR